MRESTSAPAPITPDHLARIKHDAQRGIGASSGDTLRLIEAVETLADEYDKAWRHDINDKNNVQVLAAEVARLTAEKFRCKTCYFEWTGTKDHPDTDCEAPDVRAGWRP